MSRFLKPPCDPGQSDFPSPVLTSALHHFSGVGLPPHRRAQALARIHPIDTELAYPLASFPCAHTSSSMSGYARLHEAAECPEPLCPARALLLPGQPHRSPKRALPLHHRSYGLMRQTLSLPGPQVFPSVTESSQIATSPCCDKVLPDIIPAPLCVDAWTHTPLSSSGAHTQFFPKDSGLASQEPRSADRTTPAMQLLQGAVISGRQSFASLQAPTLARPPGCPDPSASHAEPLGRLHHASPGQLPAPSCGIATCPIWAIDTVGLTPTGLQSCRLLLPTSGSSATLTSPVIKCRGCDISSAWESGNIQGTAQSPVGCSFASGSYG